MTYIHKLILAAFVLLIAVVSTTSCQSERFDTEEELSLSVPEVTISYATVSGNSTKATREIQTGSFMFVQLVNSSGTVLIHKNGKPQQSKFVYNGSSWILDNSTGNSNSNWSQYIVVTNGAGNYRMRILASFKFANESLLTPMTYYGSVAVTNSSNGIGCFSFTLAPNTSSALTVKLVRDNGAQITSSDYASGTYSVSLKAAAAALPHMEVVGNYSSFTKMNFTTNASYSVLKSAGLVSTLNTNVDFGGITSSSSYITGLTPSIIPSTISKGTAILSISKTSGSGTGNVYTVFAPSAMTLSPGKSYTITVAVGVKDAVVTGFTISNLEPGEDINPTNRYIVKDGDHYKIYNAKGLKAFSDIVNGAETSYVINGITIPVSGSYGANGMLMRDIDLSSVCSASLQKSWKPISSVAYFEGYFDGNGYTISNLYIGSSGGNIANYQGLFGMINSNSLIQNLILSDSQITGKTFIGGIAGRSKGATIVGSIVKNVTLKGSSQVGGIAAHYSNIGNIISCIVPSVNLTVTSPSGTLGGILGTYTSTIPNCYVLRSGRVFIGATNESNVVDAINNSTIVNNLNNGIKSWNSVSSNNRKCNFHYEVDGSSGATAPMLKPGSPSDI